MSLRNIRYVHQAIRRDSSRLVALAKGGGRPADVADGFRFLMDVLRAHEAGEESALFPALEPFSPGITARFEADHAEVGGALDAALELGEGGSAALLADAVDALHRHLDREERALAEVADAHLSRRDQWRIAGATAHRTPAELRWPMVRWMVANLDTDELAGAVQMWRSGMPPPAFATTVGVVREVVGPEGWDQLCELLPELVFEKPLHVQLLDTLTGAWRTKLVSALADLGVAEHLVDGPRTAAAIADAVGAYPPHLHRLLRAATTVGVLEEREGATFALSPVGQHLRRDAMPSMAPLARWAGHDAVVLPWQALADTVRDGGVGSERVFGEPYFDYLDAHPEAAAAFNAAMTGFSMGHANAVLASYDFGELGTVVDVGGGQGLLLGRLLAAHPALRGVLVDQPSVVRGAADVLDRFGVADRVEVLAGDFFHEVPPGADAYVLKMILHDWDDADAGELLRVIRRAMTDRSRLLIVEGIIPPAGVDAFTSGGFTRMLDLEMLVLTGGRERTAEEFEGLLDRADLHVHAIIPTESVVQIIDARPHPGARHEEVRS